MNKYILLALLLPALGCGIEPKVQITPQLIPESVITLEEAQCTCPLLPPGVNYVLVPTIEFQAQ